MTVGDKVQLALTSLKGVQADLETFSLQTQDNTAKLAYQHAAQECQEIIKGLQNRLAEIQQQEPQFKKP